MNNKSIVIDSIYSIEESEINSGFDTVCSMIEASDKAYSIIKECREYDDYMLDMFSIFQEDGDMDPDQHGKKISDMNKDEKRAYREKHAFKEDTTIMTILKFIPNLLALIVRSIGNLFKKKPEPSKIKQALESIKNAPPEVQAAVKEILDGFYEQVLGGDPNKGTHLRILGIEVSSGLIGTLFGAALTVAIAFRSKLKELVLKIFKKDGSGEGKAKKIKYGLKYKHDENKNWYWVSTLKLDTVKNIINSFEGFNTKAQLICDTVAKGESIKDQIGYFKKTYEELNTQFTKNLLSENMEEIEMSNENLVNDLTNIYDKIGGSEAGIIGSLKKTSEMYQQQSNDTDKINSFKENHEAEYNDYVTGLEYLKDILSKMNSLFGCISSMKEHVEKITEGVQTGLRGTFANFFKDKNEKLYNLFSGRNTGKEKHENAGPEDDSDLITADDGSKYKLVQDDNDYDGVDIKDCIVRDKTGKNVLKAKGADSFEYGTETYNNLDDIYQSEEEFQILVPANTKSAEAEEEPKEKSEAEAEEKPEGESFVDTVDDDSEFVSEQSTRWYSM